MENIDNNTEIEDSEGYEFKYTFVNMPWDDRSSKSKFGIIVLLTSIFIGTMAFVINGFIMHFRGFELPGKLNNRELNCQLVKMKDYPYAVRIHSVETQEMVCVGALVTENSVLANGACVKSGPIRLLLGSFTDLRCKNGFSVNSVEPIFHDGVIAKKLVLIYTYESMAICSSVINIGTDINSKQRAFIIGRTFQGERSLSRQLVTVTGKDCVCSGILSKNLNNKKNVICVKSMARCPVLAGDLLVQNGKLYGLASTSAHSRDQNRQACFADLKNLQRN